MLSITAIAYLAGSKDGSPYLLVEKTTEKNFYTCIQINSEENTAEMALREEINKKISGISSDLKEGTFIASFIDFQENPQKRKRFAIYLFQLPEKFSIPDSYSFLPLDKLESCFEPTLNHGLKLLKHAYQHHLCTSSCSHSVQQKAIAFITRGEGTNTEILMLKKNAVLNNKGKNLGEKMKSLAGLWKMGKILG